MVMAGASGCGVVAAVFLPPLVTKNGALLRGRGIYGDSRLMKEHKPPLREIIKSAGLALVGSALELFFPNWGVVTAPAIAAIDTNMTYWLQRRAASCASEAEAVAGQSIEEIVSALSTSDSGVALLLGVSSALETAAFEEKCRALGACLGNAAKSADAELAAESEAVWVRIISRLENPHVRMLKALNEAVVGDPMTAGQGDWFVAAEDLKLQAEWYGGSVRAAVWGELVGLGLVEYHRVMADLNPKNPDGMPLFKISEAGREVVERLRKSVPIRSSSSR